MASRKYSLSDFAFKKLIGEGAYSSVYLATQSDTGQSLAIKTVNKRHIIKHAKTKYVAIEKDVLSLLKHPYIVKLFCTFQDQTNLYFALEYVHNGDLLNLLTRFNGKLPSNHAIQFYSRQIIIAVNYLHAQNIIHRDLKPENILIDDHLNIKLTDFGSAKMLLSKTISEPDTQQSENKLSFVGTAEYCSPELLNDKTATFASDVWAIGCMLCQLASATLPFRGANEYQTFQLISECKYTLSEDMSDNLKALVQGILVSNPEVRMTISNIMTHSYFPYKEHSDYWDASTPFKSPLLPKDQDTFIFPTEDTESDEFEASLVHLPEIHVAQIHLRKDQSVIDPNLPLNNSDTLEVTTQLEDTQEKIQGPTCTHLENGALMAQLQSHLTTSDNPIHYITFGILKSKRSSLAKLKSLFKSVFHSNASLNHSNDSLNQSNPSSHQSNQDQTLESGTAKSQDTISQKILLVITSTRLLLFKDHFKLYRDAPLSHCSGMKMKKEDAWRIKFFEDGKEVLCRLDDDGIGEYLKIG